MKKKYFGTDGIRASSNSEKLNGPTLINLGMALGKYFIKGDHRHKVVIGKDTRLSGYCLLYTSPSPRDVSLSRMPSSA